MKITKNRILMSTLAVAVIGALALPVIGTLDANAAGFGVPVVHAPEEAGYQAGNPLANSPWHYRYVQAQVTLPDVTGNVDKASFAGYGVSVRLTNVTESAVLGISTTPGSGSYSPAFVLEAAPTGGTIGSCSDLNSKFIPAGDTVVFSIYFDGSHLSANVTDKDDATKDFAFTCTDPTPGDLFDQAQIGTEFGVSPWTSGVPTPPSGIHPLATFSNTVITNRTGIRGSVGSAPWPTQKLVIVNGSNVVRATPSITWGTGPASPDNVSRPGRNFSVSLLGGSL